MLMRDDGPALLPVYATFPLRAASGHGSWLVDETGMEWLDAYGGHAVATVGHSHPDVVAAIAEQAARLLFYSTAVPHAGRERLAEVLARHAPGALGKVFFCNSGAEANENLLGLARRKTGRTTVVTMRGGWHGRTAATLACTDGAKYEAGAKLLFDEVQCGVGRLGTFTAAESFGVIPDALSMAKGLASGLPMGAVLAQPSLVDDLAIGDLGSTFGGGPVVCAAALANISVIEREELLENVRRVSAQLRAGAEAMPHVRRVHGRGFLLGLELDRPAVEVQRALWALHILTGTSTDPQTLRLLPPLSLSSDEAALLLDGLRTVLSA